MRARVRALFLLVAFGAARATVKSHYARDEGKTIARIRGALASDQIVRNVRGRSLAHPRAKRARAPVYRKPQQCAYARAPVCLCVCVREKLGEHVCAACADVLFYWRSACAFAARTAHH